MTALNVLVQQEAVHFLTDCVALDSQLRVGAIGSKIVVAEGISMAFALAGMVNGIQLKEQFDSIRLVTQKDILDALPAVASAIRRNNAANAPRGVPPDLQIVAGLWNFEKRAPEAWAISTEGDFLGASYRPGAVVQIGQLFSPNIHLQNCLGRTVNPRDRRQFHAEREGGKVIDAQRRYRWPDGSYAVGGRAELMTVSAAGVTQKTIRDWPDEIGRPIQPATA